ncbi:CAP domain-containing protein [Roseobacteraceae bacterium S113]
MVRTISLMMALVFGVAACTTTTAPPQLGSDGKPLPRLYRISPAQEGRIQFRVLDSVNSLREASGAGAVALNAQLNAAAATHARDMSIQNRPWHFGSDGSSPIDRVRRVGYTGRLIGEAISETYETEVQTLAAWMEQEGTRRIILSPDARDMGFAFFQEQNGKIWWTLVMGGAGEVLTPADRPSAEVQSANRVVSAIAGAAIELVEDQ